MAWYQPHALLGAGKLWAQITIPLHDPMVPIATSIGVLAWDTKLWLHET